MKYFESNVRKLIAVLMAVLVAVTSIIPTQAQQPRNLPSNSPAAANQAAGVALGKPELQIYNMPAEMVGTVAAALRIKFSRDPSVTITIEPGTDRMMVLAPLAVHQQIAENVRRVNEEAGVDVPVAGGPPLAPAETQRIYQLRHANWEQIEEHLTKIGGRQLSVFRTPQGDIADYRLPTTGRKLDDVRVDRRNSSLLLQGSTKNVSAWQRVIAAMDNSHSNVNASTEFAPLEQARPDRIRRAVQLVRMVAFQSDDVPTDSTGVVQLESDTSATDLAATAIGSADSLGQESGLFGDVQIEFVPELGLVIVRGSKRDVQRVLEVIEQVKQQSAETQPQVDVIPLKHVDSVALAAILNDLYTANFAPRQGSVSITGLGQPNAILLIGRPESMTAILDLINKLDKPLDPSSQLKVFKLLHTSAVDLQTIVRDFFVTRPGSATDPRAGLGVRVSVIADYRTNALIIQAAPRDLLEVAKLIEEIDVASTQAENEIKVFPLRNALSDDLQPILQSAINGAAPEGASDRATPVSSKLSVVTGPNTRANSGILAGVVVTSNPSINSLVVRAPAKSMELIGALITQLDQPPNLEAQLKVFPIKNNDPTALAQVIQQLFGLPVTAGVATTGIGAAFNQGNAAQTGGNDPLVPLRVTVDTRSKSIIVSGSRGDLEVVEVLLQRLDEEGVQTRRTEVVWLRNSNATDVATAISTFLLTQRTNIQNQLVQGQAISVTEQIDREVIVVAEPTTNSLIVSATPQYYDNILSVISRLDRRPPLIMVQILLAEVSIGDTFEFGAELGLQDSLLFDRNSATGGTLGSPGFNILNPLGTQVVGGQPQQVAGQGLSTFGLGRTNTTLGYGGLVLSAASESVSILVRALQDAQRLQILSRPQIMTLDTVEAFVQVGSLVPRVQSVSGGNGLTAPIINTVDKDVGLIMRIQPRTNQDGLILLDVQIERSALGPVGTGIPVGFAANGTPILSPIINTTRAQTRVSAYDGQTVVFAGLIQKTHIQNSRRVPYLSDIPVIGNAFKFDSENEVKSELLVVMTPRIVDSQEDVDTINALESARMSWCMADVVNVTGVNTLSPGYGLWGAACSPVIYPDVNPNVEFIDGMPSLAPGEIIIDDPMNGYPELKAVPNVSPMMKQTIPQINSPSSVQPIESGATTPIQAASQYELGYRGNTQPSYQPSTNGAPVVQASSNQPVKPNAARR